MGGRERVKICTEHHMEPKECQACKTFANLFGYMKIKKIVITVLFRMYDFFSKDKIQNIWFALDRPVVLIWPLVNYF